MQKSTPYHVIAYTCQRSPQALSAQCPPQCLLYPYFFDVVTKIIDVATNFAQTMPTHYALKFSWEKPYMLTFMFANVLIANIGKTHNKNHPTGNSIRLTMYVPLS